MKVDTEVLAVLSRATVEAKAVVLNGQLDRKLYERTNKVLEAAGGKWNRKARAHVFDTDADTRIEQIILTGDVVVPQDFGYFPTPPAVVSRLLDLADIEPGMTVLEPSAGKGAIAFAVAAVASGVCVDCVELLDQNVAALADDMRLGSLQHCDFLTVTPTPIYDRVVMNPPFEKQADIRHVLHALKFLKPGGLLVSVMASSVVFRDNKLTADFRALVNARGGALEALPEGSFKASGTGVNTVIVVIPAEVQ